MVASPPPEPLVKRLAAVLAAAAAHSVSAQGLPAYGCDSPESKQLDFWVGEWELSYVEDGKAGKSRNRITKSLDGCVIFEEFSGAPGTKLDGRSVSTFDRLTRRWKQTWVDNTGSYLDFTGGLREGHMHFAREAETTGGKFHQRMIWQEVKRDSMKWLWQRSDDGGRTWATQWEIDYRRVK
jgi:hypothetical protein